MLESEVTQFLRRLRKPRVWTWSRLHHHMTGTKPMETRSTPKYCTHGSRRRFHVMRGIVEPIAGEETSERDSRSCTRGSSPREALVSTPFCVYAFFLTQPSGSARRQSRRGCGECRGRSGHDLRRACWRVDCTRRRGRGMKMNGMRAGLYFWRCWGSTVLL